MLPVVGAGLVATAVFGFIQAWNEYIIAYVLLSSPGNQTLTVWLASFTTNHGPEWGPLMAAATLTGLPVVAFFLIVQRYLAGGLPPRGRRAGGKPLVPHLTTRLPRLPLPSVLLPPPARQRLS